MLCAGARWNLLGWANGNLKIDEAGEYKLSKVGGGARRRELKNVSYIHKIRTLGTKSSNE